MDFYGQCWCGQYSLVILMQNFIIYSAVLWLHKYRKRSQNAQCNGPTPNWDSYRESQFSLRRKKVLIAYWQLRADLHWGRESSFKRKGVGFPTKKSTREICRPISIAWWTTEGASNFPSGPIKSVDVLPDSTDSRSASSGSLSSLALRGVKRSWSILLEGCDTRRSCTDIAGTGRMARSAKLQNCKAHGVAPRIRTETRTAKRNLSLDYGGGATTATRPIRADFKILLPALCLSFLSNLSVFRWNVGAGTLISKRVPGHIVTDPRLKDT